MKRVNNLIVISCTHIGCQLGLCPPAGFKLDEGAVVGPSPFQREVWKIWKEAWDKWIPLVCRGEPFALIHLGDVIDGEHHRSVTPFSNDLEKQATWAIDTLQPYVNRAAAYYQLRGTEAHDGIAGQQSERIAKALGAIPNEVGQYARYELWKLVGGAKQNALVHFAHHIGTTGTSHYESTAVLKELTENFVESARWGERAPDYVIRGHRHRAIEVKISGANGQAKGIVIPGWQGKTPHAYRIAGGRQSLPQFGMALIRQGDEEHYDRSFTRSIKRPDAE